MNLIKDYVNIVSEITDAPKTFLIASAYHYISSTIGKYVVCPFLSRSVDKPFKPNLWSIISGLPGISRKSTVMNLELDALKISYREYYSLANPRMTQDNINEIIHAMIIQQGSPEGIVDHIVDLQDRVDTFLIMSSEWGNVLRQIKNQRYMEELANLLSKLHDGDMHVWYGSKRVKDTRNVRYIRQGLYVTFLTGMQRLGMYVDPYYLDQGLLRRVLIVYAKPSDKDKWLPPIDLTIEMKIERLKELAEQVGELMYDYSAKAPIIAHLTGEVKNRINEYARNVERVIIENPESNWSKYAQSLWVHLSKLTILNAISRKRPVPSGGLGYIITIEEQDFIEAKNYLESILPNMQEAISEIGVKIRRVPMEDYQTVLERIYGIIVSAGPSGITTRELLMRSGLIKEHLKTYILNLMEQEKVEVYRYTPRRGRPSIIIVATSYRNNYSDKIIKSEKVDANMLNMMW